MDETRGYLPFILDLGTGNGSTLISLALEEGVQARMVGVDYSAPSILLAQQLWVKMLENHQRVHGGTATSIVFAVFDVIRGGPKAQSWWPCDYDQYDQSKRVTGFDLVLDKGTFDAISLSSDTVRNGDGKEEKTFETYPAKVGDLIRPGGYFLITSCNWTEREVIKRFSIGEMQDVFEVFHRIQYPVYQFGGQQGQGVASVCFRRKAR